MHLVLYLLYQLWLYLFNDLYFVVVAQIIHVLQFELVQLVFHHVFKFCFHLELDVLLQDLFYFKLVVFIVGVIVRNQVGQVILLSRLMPISVRNGSESRALLSLIGISKWIILFYIGAINPLQLSWSQLKVFELMIKHRIWANITNTRLVIAPNSITKVNEEPLLLLFLR